MKVLLVDDEALVMAAMRSVIRRIGEDVTVIAVPDPPAAERTLLTDHGFDLCLLHIEPEEPGGCDALIGLRRDHPALPVVALSTTEKPSEVVRMVELGAMGCVPRRLEGDQMFSALAMVFSGGVYIPPVVLGLLRGTPVTEGDTVPSVMRPSSEPAQEAPADNAPSSTFARTEPDSLLPADAAGDDATADAPARSVARPAALDGLGLTPRQCDVLALLLKGLPNKLIAREMNLAVDTVKDHVAAVLRALNVNSRTQAVLAVSQMTLTAAGGGWRLPP